MENRTIYKRSIERLNESLVWTHKIQMCYLEYLESCKKNINIIKIFLNSATSISTTICAIFGNYIGTIICAILTFLSLVISNILDNIFKEETIIKFQNCSNVLCNLKNKIVVLIDEINANKIDEINVKNVLSSYNEIMNNALKNMPTIPNRFVKKADKKLNKRKDEEVEIKIDEL